MAERDPDIRIIEEPTTETPETPDMDEPPPTTVPDETEKKEADYSVLHKVSLYAQDSGCGEGPKRIQKPALGSAKSYRVFLGPKNRFIP